SFLPLTMPPTRAGSLQPEEYVNIVAYILQTNGVAAGNQALTASTTVAIGSLVAAPAANAQPGGNRQQEPAGITVPGEVKNYVPVTDAMLRNPAAGDWLMLRRDYHASNFSPLTQITRDNV